MSAEYVTEPVAKPKRKISVFDFFTNMGQS